VNPNQAHEEAANLEGLRHLAIWLEGLKKGQGGSLNPLGAIVLEDLWKAIRELEDNRRKAKMIP